MNNKIVYHSNHISADDDIIKMYHLFNKCIEGEFRFNII